MYLDWLIDRKCVSIVIFLNILKKLHFQDKLIHYSIPYSFFNAISVYLKPFLNSQTFRYIPDEKLNFGLLITDKKKCINQQRHYVMFSHIGHL